MPRIKILIFVFFAILLNNNVQSSGITHEKSINVLDFLPENYVKDGSVSYHSEIQKSIDLAFEMNLNVLFPPMKYLINECGLTLRSNMSFYLEGAVFILADTCMQDGQVFIGKDVKNINFWGGEIVGKNGNWPEGINIRGILINGNSENICIRNMYLHDLSSNGIGIIGEEDSHIRNIWISDVRIINSCNVYGDYESERPGPEPDSDRKDQGSVAFYYVDNFDVRGCIFDQSRSDGTHFYKCRRGHFSDNKVYRSRMGGYFLESCIEVTASNNIVADNGSRGVTIERGSLNCTLNGNIVSGSGRQGLWAPNCAGLVVTGNIFDKNGRKMNGDSPDRIWDANITVNSASDPTKTSTRDYLITNNIIYTSKSQIAAIHVDADKSEDIIIQNNLLKGENTLILIDGVNKGSVIIKENITGKF